MYQMIADNLMQLGIEVTTTVVLGVAYLNTNKRYLHYNEIDWIIKYNSFKGISVSPDGYLTVEVLI
jgi:hypothetical protein